MVSVLPAYFDALYDRDPDPWRFETSAYEAGKYAATLAALPCRHYASALEIGCSIGVLTAALAPRCGALLATDVAEAALAKARARNVVNPQVRFARHRFPDPVPASGFDLVLLSEVLYYLDKPALVTAAAIIRASVMPGAQVLLVHWLGPTPDYPLTGDEAADAFIAALAAQRRVQSRTRDYRIDLLQL